MAGLYVHVPFCVKKCDYCDFVSFPGREGDVARYFEALVREMEGLAPLPGFTTVFFGGGTPSLPPPWFVPKVLEEARRRAVIAPDAEITCEANPGTLTKEHVAAWRGAGVNRLSLGAQASQERLLRGIGRIHSWEQVREAAKLWGEGESLSLDLMMGLPGQTAADLEESLHGALELGIGHLSLYELILEEDVPLAGKVEAGEVALPCEEELLAMEEIATGLLGGAGFTRYEVSNWALPGRACHHNLNYWRRGEYVGLGCGAASFLQGVRLRNTGDLDEYMLGAYQRERETLTHEGALFEEAMLGLRMTGGVTLSPAAWERFGAAIGGWRERGLADARGKRVWLTRRGMQIMNTLLVELMEN